MRLQASKTQSERLLRARALAADGRLPHSVTCRNWSLKDTDAQETASTLPGTMPPHGVRPTTNSRADDAEPACCTGRRRHEVSKTSCRCSRSATDETRLGGHLQNRRRRLGGGVEYAGVHCRCTTCTRKGEQNNGARLPYTTAHLPCGTDRRVDSDRVGRDANGRDHLSARCAA